MEGYNMINIAFAGTEKGHCMPDSFCVGLEIGLPEMAFSFLLFSSFKVSWHYFGNIVTSDLHQRHRPFLVTLQRLNCMAMQV